MHLLIKSFIALGSVGFFVVLSEIIKHSGHLHREFNRKIAHIGSAVAISVWPFYLPWGYVEFFSFLLIVGIVIAKYAKLTPSIHNIRRKSYGDLLFGLAVLGVATFARSPAIFCIAILHMGLADGLAAVVGTKYGKRTKEYYVLGDRKSIAGSLTFFIVSLLLLIAFNIWSNNPVSIVALLVLPFIATAFENIGLKGADNVTVPMLIVIALSAL